MHGTFPPPLFMMSTSPPPMRLVVGQRQLQQQQQQQDNCYPSASSLGTASSEFFALHSPSPPASPISPVPPSPVSASHTGFLRRYHATEEHPKRDHLDWTTPTTANNPNAVKEQENPDDDRNPNAPMFHHRSQPYHGHHPLNQLKTRQSPSILSAYHAPPVKKHAQHNTMILTADNREQKQQRQQRHHKPPPQRERRIVLSTPPAFTRIRTSSCSVSSSLTMKPDTAAAPPPDRIFVRRQSTKLTQSTPSEGVPQLNPAQQQLIQAPPTSYESLLAQIAAQRSKLTALHTGAQILSDDIFTLNDTLEVEQASSAAVLQDAQIAIQGWQSTWKDYSLCETLETLQERPKTIAALIRAMSWQDKKSLFEQVVASCQPREAYQLQYQISVLHGQVTGFDLLGEFPLTISTLVMMRLSFADLANCRLVSRAWGTKARTYEVVSSVLTRITCADDSPSMEPVDGSQQNWNQLCRYHERYVRWRQGKPASMHAMLGHTSYVTSLKNRGEWIVSGGYDEKVRLWQASTGKCVKIWEVDSAVSCVELFVDANMDGGGVVVAAFVDIGLVKVWSLHGPLNMQTLTGHQKGVRALAVNEAYLVTAGFDQTVLVWNWTTGRKVASFRAHNEVILSVHLCKNTVYTFCIDSTLRVFDIPSKALLHQTKLFEVQQGASLQWSHLRDKMLLTATNKKIYVWQLEHLESLVQQQQHPRRSSLSSTSASTVDSDTSAISARDAQTTYLDTERQSTPPLSRSHSPTRYASKSTLSGVTTPPQTPASSSLSSSGSSYFYSSGSGYGSSSMVSLPSESDTSSSRTWAYGAAVETRVKPCLTAILNVTIDMWCGQVTHHDPPILIMGSRSSPIKLTALTLTRDIINPSKVYRTNNAPLLLSPKSVPIQGMPVGHGRGVMCIDSDSSKLVVGCTGGSIQVFEMDPAKSVLTQTSSSGVVPVITLPHLTLTQLDSIRSISPVHPSLPARSSTISATPSHHLSAVGANSTKGPSASVPSNRNARSVAHGLPSPDNSPPKVSISIRLTTPPIRTTRGVSPQRAKPGVLRQPLMPPSDFEEQEVLVDCEDENMRDIHHDEVRRQEMSNLSIVIEDRGKDSKAIEVIKSTFSPPLNSRQRASGPGMALTTTRTGVKDQLPSKASALSPNASVTPSGLSKYIPGPPARIIMRKRASSTAWADQIINTTATTALSNASDSVARRTAVAISAPAAVLKKGRNRSEPNLLSKLKNSGSAESISGSTSKTLSKNWTLSSPWNTSSRRTIKT